MIVLESQDRGITPMSFETGRTGARPGRQTGPARPAFHAPSPARLATPAPGDGRRAAFRHHEARGWSSLKRAMNDDSEWRRRDSGDPDLRPLSAFADNELSATERAAMVARVTTDPGAAERVADYRAQRAALTALFGGPRDDARYIVVRRRTRWWRQAGLATSCLVVGVALGSSPGCWLSANFVADPTVFAERADIAFAVYVPEQRHPVEVAAEQRDQLVNWLSWRLDRQLSVPSLREYGYSLIGGRLLPGESGPAAQFMYQNTAGARLTIYIAGVPKDATAFRSFRDGNRITFYWGNQGMGCALTGHVFEPQLRSMAIDACSRLGWESRSRESGDGFSP
jgi:anti-sigma factor RsiW